MKILVVAPYLYNSNLSEFTRNKTGFGMMVQDIVASLSAWGNDVYVTTNVITVERVVHANMNTYTILRHLWRDVFCHAKPSDYVTAIRMAHRFPTSTAMRAKYGYYFLNQGSFCATLKNLQPDIVHIHGIGYQMLPYIQACKALKTPFVVTLHGVIGLSSSITIPAWEKDIEKTLLRQAEREKSSVTIVSTGSKRAVCQAYGLTGDNITVVTNGADIALKAPVKINIRERYNIPSENQIVVVVGNISLNKNQQQIVDAYQLLPLNLQTKISILFAGSIGDGGTLQMKISSLPCKENLIICGFISHSDLNSFYEEASLNAVVSITEGFGLSMVEGFMHGVPTVTFDDLDAVPDLYDESAMITVKERNTAALADAIAKGLTRPWDRDRIRAFAQNFSLEQMTAKYLDVYKQTIEATKITDEIRS